jgi:5-methylcytosine-specific restriction endonuclease McrA
VFDESEYLKNFNNFLTNARFNGTQQFVFLKSLLYLAGNINGTPYKWEEDLVVCVGEKLEVDLKFIAIPYTKYYWDMLYRFRLRQSSTGNQYYVCQDCGERNKIPFFKIGENTCKKCQSKNLENEFTDVNINKNFKNSKGEPIKPPKTLDDLVKDHQNVINTVINGNSEIPLKSSLNEPLKALDEKGFYEKRKKRLSKAEPLILDVEIRDFFKKYQIILNAAINYSLTRYLEKINKYFPQVAKAVLIDIPRENLPKKEREEYDKLYKSSNCFTCFYCNKEFKIKKQARDHVIPFDYVLSENLYNSMPSCTTCNSKKSNLLPSNEIFDKVIERNKNLKNLGDYSEKEFKKIYKNCEENYHGKRRIFEFQYDTKKIILKTDN